MRKPHSLRLAGLAAATLVVIGCSGQAAVETNQLTIITTSMALDEATSLAVAEYLQTHGVEVDVQQHNAPAQVFDALEAETPEDQTVVGIVSAPQDQQVEERSVEVPDNVEIIAQAPAELGFVASTSSITAANFARTVVNAEDPEKPMADACAQQTWFHPQLPEESLRGISDALAEEGCEPRFETVETLDTETYGALIEQLIVKPDTVVMLRGLDPAISDQGLETLDVETQQWPNSNIVAVSGTEVDDALVDQITDVLDVLDSEAATTLLRGYYNAQTSVSDLQFEVDDAIRYWLAQSELSDPDTVINITRDNE